MFPAPAFPWIGGLAGFGTAVALAFVGGAVLGSFLNVVVHRVPRGGSALTGRSRCPSCGGAIGPVDLVPVVGWLLLGGRCRTCGAAIAARYPLVEATSGTLLAALAAGELAAGATGWHAVAVWAARAAVIVTILAWALLAADGHDVSSLTVAVAVGTIAAVSTLPGAGLPGIGWCGASWPRSPSWVGTALAAVIGAAGGWVTGQAVAGTVGRRAGALVGAALGWQAAFLVALMSAAVVSAVPTVARRWPGGRRRSGAEQASGGIAPAAVMAAAATVVIGWRPLLAAWRQCCQASG